MSVVKRNQGENLGFYLKNVDEIHLTKQDGIRLPSITT
jgi:hypothetical protein